MTRRLPRLGPAADAAADLARAFAELMVQLHQEAGGAPAAEAAVAQAAQLASLAASAGAACCWLDAADAPPDRALLRQSPVLAAAGPGAAAPLVLDVAGRLYLQRYYDDELRLAQRLRALDGLAGLTPAQLAAACGQLDARWGTTGGAQRLAAATILARRLAIVSGGPGTGKTTTVARALAVLLALEPGLRVALAAPTGKAAARLLETLRVQLAGLAPPERLPQEAHTLHRLLGLRPGGATPRFHAQRRLPYDLVVVDEASMLDLALAARLLDAMPEGARLVLLGDKDQLTAVETGAVFADLCAERGASAPAAAALAALAGADVVRRAGPADAAGLADAVVWLERSYRFDPAGGIGRLAACINAGDAPGALAALAAGGAGLAWHDAAPDAEALAGPLLEGYAAFRAALAGGAAPAQVLAAFARHRVLCALREGPQGSQRLNDALARRLRAAGAGPWFHGRPVIVTANDYALGLYNGDIGVTLADAQGVLQVHFNDAAGGLRTVAPARLADCETAFALTVHKAQGSEFEQVDVVLPGRDGPLLAREWLYTAVTRARAGLRLWGTAGLVQAAVQRRWRRASGLAERLQGRWG
jgi:exodeoxyribonuclease V alpha subunit